MPLITLWDVACRRGGRLLFEGLNLRLYEGAVTELRGPNGIGKSSLLRIVAGLLPAYAGLVERRAAVALADDAVALDMRQPLGRALGFWAGLDGGDADAAMAAMGIGHLASVPVAWLSTGQRKRASVARVIASGAPVWLLDEPLNGLDQDGAARLAAAIVAHAANGGTILAASHQPLPLTGASLLDLGA
ncbi:heme ABC exporter ATP-binding protein CcmA [Allosphingosinicella flava]|uniref:Heme ABC exporter ATP-binding protein CcmA n=1 Tax=Allosphingosinicella flava TaxID=2771430 RepID=A0A7T2LN75_9SPHN|nr:heme ABC exporter ATP-binding protein CcmA [Sphingosinicella flava]